MGSSRTFENRCQKEESTAHIGGKACEETDIADENDENACVSGSS